MKILITGSSNGIGLQIAKDLYDTKNTFVLHYNSNNKKLYNYFGNNKENIHYVKSDLSKGDFLRISGKFSGGESAFQTLGKYKIFSLYKWCSLDLIKFFDYLITLGYQSHHQPISITPKGPT